MISFYLNQTAKWKVKGVVNKHNEVTFADPTDIDCRFEYKRKMVRDKLGQTVISEATMFTQSAVKPDDLITYDNRDWVVISVADEVGLSGSVEFYEVMM